MSAGPIIIILKRKVSTLSPSVALDVAVAVTGLKPDANRFAVAWTLIRATVKKLLGG